MEDIKTTEDTLSSLAKSNFEINTKLSDINSTLTQLAVKPWYQEYQELIGTFFAVVIPIIISIYLSKKSEKRKKIEDYTGLTYLINKEINSIENYSKNIDEQVRILNLLKHTDVDQKHTFVYKDGPIIIGDYKPFSNNGLYSTESNFINSQITFCKIDSEGFQYNSQLMSTQIRSLFERTNNLITLSFNASDRTFIDPEHIKDQFNKGIESLTVILTETIKTKLESHKIDFIVLLSALNEYIRLYRMSPGLTLWRLKYNKKYSFAKFNLFYKNDSVDEFSAMYDFFKDKGLDELKTVERK